ncbi:MULTISPECIES: ABC-three component system protein [Vibrio]|uniref:ABC-three component system protein n=1 Tax=Vibrio TaxID=662 RepID=UPI00030C016D|nr:MULTISPECIES: ABC-three component system protein [Vibrio]OEE52403.1 hypothetical protein A146_23565 [Vibrio splendidus FF-500]QPK04838.1 HNH endonuclease [Vibrio kanaloae]TCW02594.1 HNH endonuclease [Vibrio crassostreae]CAK3275789.1 HNH endonuclease [Vibrio crassostreae]CAK3579562.1 HNH endonuclease [Vibrio crassostreae]
MSRREPSPNERTELFSEASGVCPMPKCKKPLNDKRQGKIFNRFDVAHIYPSSPTEVEEELLKNEERLHPDSENLDNMIALCKPCHDGFDKPRTVKGYREMCELKIQLKKKNDIAREWHSVKIEEEVISVINKLSTLTEDDIKSAGVLTHQPKKVDDKVKSDKSIGLILANDIKNNVVLYYNVIKNQFSELDKIEAYKSELIYTQIKLINIKLKSKGLTNSEILSNLSLWIKNSTGSQNDKAIELVASFFVQNCEALE